MPFLVLILTAIGGAIWWWVRTNPREAMYVAKDAATMIRNAPRKLAFRSQATAHPTEGIDDPRIAICAIAQAFLELDDLPTKEQRQQLNTLLRSELHCDPTEAEEMEVLGRWLITQCNGAKPAVTRLARRLYKIDGDKSWDGIQNVLGGLAGDALSAAQIDAVEDIRIALHR